MKIGFYTDTYFPQISGVATSIRTLKSELEKRGHEVVIFTTTDPHAEEQESDIVRMPSIPFISFKDRRIVVSGMLDAYETAKELELDIIHTHTEFGAGFLGKQTAKHLDIPAIHTYHTMYEDYLHYIAKGKLIKPHHVRQASKAFCRHFSGIVCPSQRVVDTLNSYNITVPKAIIPTGVDLAHYQQPIDLEKINIRETYQLKEEDMLLLSLSRLSYEKNIQGILTGMPKIIQTFPQAKLLVVGDGPYRAELEELAKSLHISDYVNFVGAVDNQQVNQFYRQADYFVCASDSESQGLTYLEALASELPVVVKGSPYLDSLITSEIFGSCFKTDEAFADTFIEYVRKDIQEDERLRQAKLYEISSERFGRKVEQFYLEAITFHERYKMKPIEPKNSSHAFRPFSKKEP
ncbi:glycosyltransferase family 4 protein [Vagococcus humatus]|uniref:1,2-diacylglycerol 3-glucosyltransferase n=1 Tax=Vagococcus humatus TaxID=1889241 RepID=A0A3S0AEP8_9ENTE|nr:glycosyltransferase family 4 protein [Vagococcus humatus]RST89945.1 1,2-diacylglycerol 3-glucosyltransferase [Vagococcus humatus]